MLVLDLLYYLRFAILADLVSQLPAELRDFLLWHVIFSNGILLLLKLQIESNGIHQIVAYLSLEPTSVVTEQQWNNVLYHVVMLPSNRQSVYPLPWKPEVF